MEFSINLRHDSLADPDGLRGGKIAAGDIVLTRLLRPNQAGEDGYLEAPPAQLAFWLVDNWWRLRWEGRHSSPTSDWRLAHDMSSIGGGYVWPRLCLWGVDSLVACQSRSDPPGVVGPVRYLTDALCFVAAESFETATDGFVERLIEAKSAAPGDAAALKAQWDSLRAERADPDASAWRRMEARLGYDIDEAPELLIEAMGKLARRFGADNVEEAAMAAPGEDAPDILQNSITAASNSTHRCDFRSSLQLVPNVGRPPGLRMVDRTDKPPWTVAEDAARALRAAAGIGRGPVLNRALGDLTGATTKVFDPVREAGAAAYGLRLADAKGVQQLALRSSRGPARRFEVARALGDAIWSRGSRLGPMGDADSARQRFQRAFAQALLCPIEGLENYLGVGEATDDDIDAAARRFHVSEGVVRTVLVNKGRIDRSRLRSAFTGGALDLDETPAAA